MKNIISYSLVKRFVYSLLLLLGYTLSAQSRPTTNDNVVDPGGSGGGGTPGGVVNTTPIDMYEGILLAVAVVMMIGYYLYTRNRRAINA